MKSHRFISLIMVFILALSMALPVLAQDDEVPDEPEDAFMFEITGVIEITDDGDIMMEDIVIAPAGTFNPSDLADLPEGQEVTITGYLLNDTTLQAVTFELAEDEDADTGDEDTVAEDEDADTADADTTDACDVVDDEGDADTGDTDADTEDADATDECEEVWLNPVGEALAEEFDLDNETIAEWRDEGLGYGAIARALLIAEQLDDVEAQDVIDALDEYGNWGAVMSMYDVSPSSLAPGRVISNRPERDNGPQANTNGNGNGRGNGGGNGNGNGRGNGGGNGNGNGGGNGGGNGNGNGGGNGNGRGNG